MGEWPDQPYCECGDCHLKLLPADAWKVAGEGDLKRLAVLPGHETAFDDADHVLEHHAGWIAVGSAAR